MIKYLSAPFKWFFKLEAASGLFLLIAAIIALILSNTNFSDLYFGILSTHILIGTENFGLDLSILHWINDALMAIFFFVVTFINCKFNLIRRKRVDMMLPCSRIPFWWFGYPSRPSWNSVSFIP